MDFSDAGKARFDADKRSEELQSQFAPDNAGSALKTLDRGAAVVGVKQPSARRINLICGLRFMRLKSAGVSGFASASRVAAV